MGYRLIRHTPSIKFMRWRLFFFFFSMALMAATGFLFFTKGLNLGIDFTGGIIIEARAKEDVNLKAIRPELNSVVEGEVSLQQFGDSKAVLVRIQSKEGEEQAPIVTKAKEILEKHYPGIEYRKIDYVGPTVGEELVNAGIMAVFASLGAILIYVWFRFEWQYGVGAIIALFHDAVIMIGFYLVSGFEFGLPAVAAVLTVVGYSINDSVVIYDRIRETLRKYKQKPVDEVIDISINETLSRTILTGGTTALAALALVIFGGETILGFSSALLFGVVFGTYSSVYISAPVLIYFNLRSSTLRGTAEQTF